MDEKWNKNHKIGHMIKCIRTDLGDKLTQQQFADKIDVSRSLIAHAESKNHVPSDDVFVKIASAFSRDIVEYEIFLRKLRRAALYTKNPSAFHDAMTLTPDQGDNDYRLEVVLPEFIQFALQDALLNEGMNIKDLATKIFQDIENTDFDDDSNPELDFRNIKILELILNGKKRISLNHFRMICDLLKCDSAEFELTMGFFPESLKSATKTNRALVKMLASLNRSCEQLDSSELTEYVQQITQCMNKDRNKKP